MFSYIGHLISVSMLILFFFPTHLSAWKRLLFCLLHCTLFLEITLTFGIRVCNICPWLSIIIALCQMMKGSSGHRSWGWGIVLTCQFHRSLMTKRSTLASQPCNLLSHEQVILLIGLFTLNRLTRLTLPLSTRKTQKYNTPG